MRRRLQKVGCFIGHFELAFSDNFRTNMECFHWSDARQLKCRYLFEPVVPSLLKHPSYSPVKRLVWFQVLSVVSRV